MTLGKKEMQEMKDVGDIIDNLMASIPGMVSRYELIYLYVLASRVEKGVIVEIGSYQGLSTVCLAKGSKAGHNIPVFSIDPQNRSGFTPDSEWNIPDSLGTPDEIYYTNVGTTLDLFEETLVKFEVDDIVTPLAGYSEQIYKRGIDGIPWGVDIGLLFIDGDHRYNYAKMDMENFGKRVIKGGSIIFHDASMPSVITVIRELLIDNPKYSCTRCPPGSSENWDEPVFTAVVL